VSAQPPAKKTAGLIKKETLYFSDRINWMDRIEKYQSKINPVNPVNPV